MEPLLHLGTEHRIRATFMENTVAIYDRVSLTHMWLKSRKVLEISLSILDLSFLLGKGQKYP